jgi:Glycosyl hydrolase family 26
VAAALIAVAGIVLFVVGQWPDSGPSSSPPTALAALLRQGTPDTGPGYWEQPSRALVAAAAGAEDARFRALGTLLVKDGFAGAIIDLGREMTGGWYDWSERKCPRAEPDCYVLAWRHVVDAMRSVPGQHFRFLWTVFPGTAAASDAWPGAAYVNLVGTDIYDWYGGPDRTYPHTASGQLDHNANWREILTEPGGLDWLAQLSRLTGKPIAIPEWGLDFHSFGGQDDPAFITRMLGWLHAHHAIGVYWAVQHVGADPAVPPGPLLAGLGADANGPAGVNDLGLLLGGRLQYTEAFLPEDQPVSDSSAQPVLAPWQGAGYQLILDVSLVPLTVPSYSGQPDPVAQTWQLADYPDALAAFRRGVYAARRS